MFAFRVLGLTSLLVWAPACQKLAGIETKELVSPDAGTETQNQADCEITAQGSALLRVAQTLPTDTQFEVCLRRAGTSSAFEGLFSNNTSGASCPKGLSYTQETATFGFDAGSYDVKVVPVDASCDSDGFITSQVTLTTDASTTLFIAGPNTSAASLVSYRDEAVIANQALVRFIHTYNGMSNVTVGLANAATGITPLFSDVSFLEIAKATDAAILQVDAQGYLHMASGATSNGLAFGLADSNSPSTVLTSRPTNFEVGHVYSMFSLGLAESSDYPLKLWYCDDTKSEGILASCGIEYPIRFDIYEPLITDLFTTLIGEREEPALEAISQANTDVLCLTEIYKPEQIAKLKSLSATNFPYSVFGTDVVQNGTVTGSLADQSGNIPTYPDTTCSGTLNSLMSEFMDCMTQENSCVATSSENEEHYFTNAGASAMNCIIGSQTCASYAVAILTTSDAEDLDRSRCYMCGITELSSYKSLEQVKTACTTPSTDNPHLAFGGTPGVVVLSKHELGTPELIMLPSFGWQRAVLRVPVKLPSGDEVDYYCGHLGYVNDEYYIQYAGPYGNGSFKEEGSRQEQQLQASRLVEEIETMAATRRVPAVIGVLAQAGPEIKVEDQVIVDAKEPETYNILLSKGWGTLIAPNYSPQCTYCPDNPIVPFFSDKLFGKGTWQTHLFGRGINRAQVLSTKRTFTDPVVTVTDDDGNQVVVPLSPHYGLESTVAFSY